MSVGSPALDVKTTPEQPALTESVSSDTTAPSATAKRQRKKLQKWEVKKKEKRLRVKEKLRQRKLDAVKASLPIRNSPSRKERNKKQ